MLWTERSGWPFDVKEQKKDSRRMSPVLALQNKDGKSIHLLGRIRLCSRQPTCTHISDNFLLLPQQHQNQQLLFLVCSLFESDLPCILTSSHHVMAILCLSWEVDGSLLFIFQFPCLRVCASVHARACAIDAKTFFRSTRSSPPQLQLRLPAFSYLVCLCDFQR